jgi:SAM-dependent methyltransferase
MTENRFSSEDRRRIRVAISDKYRMVAMTPEGNFKYPTGRAGLEGQNYDPEIIKTLPEPILASYCGVGNPFSLGPIARGESVLDIGCGAGVDTIVAAITAGPEGRVIGLDLTPEMLKRAKENLSKTLLENVSFEEGSAEDLSFPEASFDVVISNGVFNLVPDKTKALREVFRVLKPNGRFMMADQVLATEPPADTGSMVEKWAG